VQIGVMVIRI